MQARARKKKCSKREKKKNELQENTIIIYMLHSRYFKYEKTKPVFGAPIANYIMRMSVNKCLRLYDHSEQACTESKDQIKLKLFSCAKQQKKNEHMNQKKKKNCTARLKLVYVFALDYQPIFTQLSRAI